jgi:regulator of protease activity HflC (stomatin/prohibitin superfamily)
MIQVNVTERMADVEPLDMITKDNLNARVDLVVYYKVKPTEDNIKKSLYNVDDVESQIISLAQTTARNIIGDMVFKDVNSKRNTLNTQLAEILDKQSDAWGIQVVRVELKEITPPKDVQETMNRVIKAENEKDAAKDFATAKETEADGIKRAKIKEAEGEKQYSILKAEGQAKAFDLIEKSFKSRAELLRRLEVTENSLKNNSKIVLTQNGITPQIIMDSIPTKQVK